MRDRAITLLLVSELDDDEIFLRQMLRQVAPGRYTLEHVRTIDEVCLALEERDFDLCFCDFDVGAKTLLERFRRSECEVPVIVLSHRGDPATERQITEMGAADLLATSDLSARLLERAIRYAITRKSVENQLKRRAEYDTLTELPGRQLLMRRLEVALERTRMEKGHEVALVLLDLDRFKFVNDSMGHAKGDQVLVALSRRLEECVRANDTVCRLGGDEFVLLLTGKNMATTVPWIVDKVYEALEKPFILVGQPVYTSTSIGISICTDGCAAPVQMMRDADTAMYRAKRKGHGQQETYDPVMLREASERLRMESDLRRAMDRGEFHLVYQPIIDTRTGAVSSMEALIRWNHPTDGFVSPADFIPVAEETGMIMPIGWWVLRTACLEAAHWQESQGAELAPSLNVNLSPRQFASPDMILQIRKALSLSGLVAEKLVLEITESSLLEHPESATDMFRAIRELGVRVVMDDFGTGFSSLAQLEKFPLTGFKMDRSFLENLLTNSRRRAVVTSILSLGKALDMRVTAEGVETAEQMHCLMGLGCFRHQGWHFARPMVAEDVRCILAERKRFVA
jgi:diguanylate cyclase (GGDEF)-like protein